MTVHAPIGDDAATSNIFAPALDSVGDAVVAAVGDADVVSEGAVVVSGVIEGVTVS